MKTLWYNISSDNKILEVFSDDNELICKIPCEIEQSILELIETWFQENNIQIDFDQLIPL